MMISAGEKKKKWSPINFSKLINLILGDINTHIVLIGGYQDKNIADSIISEINSSHKSKIANSTGSLSLPDIITILNQAKLLISNDTGVYHIASSLGIPTICISIGNHYKRFSPYPSEINASTITIFPPILNKLNENERIVKYSFGSDLDINSITSEMVFKEVIR